MRPLKTTKNRVFPRMSTLRTGQPQVNDSCPVFSPAPSMTCDELERLSQVMRASRCFRTCFPFSGLCTPCEMRGTSRFARTLVRRNIARAGMGRSSTWSPRQRVVEAHVGRGREKGAEPADKPGSVVDSHSSGRIVTDTLKQPTRRHRGPRHCLPIWSCSRWGLPCRSVARLAVRSYRTVSPLPRTPGGAVRRSALCCTFRRLAPPRRYLAPCPVEPGLSSAPRRVTRLPGRLRGGSVRGKRGTRGEE